MRSFHKWLRRLIRKPKKKTNFLETKTFQLLKGLEGWRTEPYILNNVKRLNPYKHKSGLTVGAGFDMGQHSVNSLKKMGLPSSFIKKCKESGFLGLNPDTITDKGRITGHELMTKRYYTAKSEGTLPVFSEEELGELAEVIYRPYEKAARKKFDRVYGKGEFNKRKEEVRALLTLELYHRGTGISLNDTMMNGAYFNNVNQTALGIKWKSRRRNAFYILNKME